MTQVGERYECLPPDYWRAVVVERVDGKYAYCVNLANERHTRISHATLASKWKLVTEAQP